MAVVVLLAYYGIRFGLSSPFENLYGDYSRRAATVGPVRVRANVPLAPDKFVTLLGLGGTLGWLGAAAVQRGLRRPNPLSRLLRVTGSIALIPLGLYLLTYGGLLGLLGLILYGGYALVRYIVAGG